MDSEQAAIPSFQKSFSESKLSGCLFHLSKSYMRKIVELGLKKDHETNHEVALALKMLPSLAFENEEEIGNAYVPGAQSTGFSTKKVQNIMHACVERTANLS